MAAFAPSVGAHEPAFDALWDATLTQTPVAFAYRGVDRVVEQGRPIAEAAEAAGRVDEAFLARFAATPVTGAEAGPAGPG